jgi:hypothetical protein
MERLEIPYSSLMQKINSNTIKASKTEGIWDITEEDLRRYEDFRSYQTEVRHNG